MILLALACAAPEEFDAWRCDARAMEPGEVRARQIPCSDEVPDGADARSGDWVVENAVARFFVRGTYAPLTELEGDGGTLIDTFGSDDDDLLLELLPSGDRSSIEVVEGVGWSELRLPGAIYHLDADADWLDLVTDATMRTIPGTSRTGATLRDHGAFVGVDGVVVADSGVVTIEGATRVALTPEARWPDGDDIEKEVDADTVRVEVDGVVVDRLDVDDGVVSGRIAAGAKLVGERDGCQYDGLTQIACGELHVRIHDELGNDLRGEVTDGSWEYTVPMGGGVVPVDPTPRRLWVWAGPAYGYWPVDYAGGTQSVDATLRRAVTLDHVGLAALALEVGPDADTDLACYDVVHTVVGEGVRYAVVVADDEIPEVSTYTHDPIDVAAGSRAKGEVWSWSWSQNDKKPAHGAVPWQKLDDLDILAMAEGGEGTGRLTVVDRRWVRSALTMQQTALWDPRPDAIWLDSLGDVPTYLDLLDRWVDVAPLATRTWIEYIGYENDAAYEAGIVDGRVSAGNGPRVTLTPGDQEILVTVEAPRWMKLDTVTVYLPGREASFPIDGAGQVRVTYSRHAPRWAVATVRGAHARPWGDEIAWAVSAPLWFAPEP